MQPEQYDFSAKLIQGYQLNENDRAMVNALDMLPVIQEGRLMFIFPPWVGEQNLLSANQFNSILNAPV